MTVSMMQIIIEFPDVYSIKDKRKYLKSIKDRVVRKFRVSAAEIDLQDSRCFCQLGFAVVSNSTAFGESIMNKILDFIEDLSYGRIQENSIFSENYY